MASTRTTGQQLIGNGLKRGDNRQLCNGFDKEEAADDLAMISITTRQKAAWQCFRNNKAMDCLVMILTTTKVVDWSTIASTMTRGQRTYCSAVDLTTTTIEKHAATFVTAVRVLC